jgi:fission 1 protein
MRTTKSKQRTVRRQLDEKLSLSTPPHELLEELASKCTSDPNPDNTFQYAFALSKSRDRSELQYSIAMLDSLVKNGYEHQVDCMFGSATAHYLLNEYDEARFLCEAILRNRPENEAAAQLHTAALSAKDDREEKMVRDVAIGGTAAVAAVGLALLLGGRKR